MTTSLDKAVAEALAAGTPKAALDAAAKAPLSSSLALGVAEAYEATGRGRRGAALLLLAARADAENRAVVVAAARAMLRLGRRGRARRLLDPLGNRATVLAAVASGAPLPESSDAYDGDDVVDFALASGAPLPELQTILVATPGCCRLRIEVARRQADAGDVVNAKATLRAGLAGGRQDARLELALAMLCFGAGDFDEAAVVVAKARSRHAACAKDNTLLMLLAAAQVGADHRDNAISVVHGAVRPDPALLAFAAMLSPASVVPATAPGTTSSVVTSNAPTSTTAPAASGTAASASSPVPAKASAWRGVVDSEPTPAPSSRGPLAAVIAVVAAVAVIGVARSRGDDDNAPLPNAGPVAVADAGVVNLSPSLFSQAATRCGVRDVPGWVDVPSSVVAFSESAAAQGWGGGARPGWASSPSPSMKPSRLDLPIWSCRPAPAPIPPPSSPPTTPAAWSVSPSSTSWPLAAPTSATSSTSKRLASSTSAFCLAAKPVQG